ncbi:SIR2 family NAD-dependent protein deacylase [Natronospora cellulosivora (SeqCode)]
MIIRKEIESLAKWIKEANSIVILTGAGASTESGIPDFRSQGGIYESENPLFRKTLENDYQGFYDFCMKFFHQFRDCQPNQVHKLIAKWEKEGLVDVVITQNVDNLHQKAGSKNVIELHGTMETASCITCEESAPIEDFFDKKPCHICDGRLRPNIVLFGDPLPQDELNRAFKLSQEADLYIVIGSSLEVMPANQLPFLSNAKKVLINKESIHQIADFDLFLKGSAGEIMNNLKKTI